MGTLLIHRPARYADSLRRYRLFIDGACEGKIGSGETMEFEVSPGQHVVVAKIDWCSSNTLHLEVEDRYEYRLEVGPNVTGWRMLLALVYISFLRSQYLYLKLG